MTYIPTTTQAGIFIKIANEGVKHYLNHKTQKNQQAQALVALKQQQEKEKMNMQLMVAGTLATEAVKMGSSILAHKQAIYAIDAELTKAEQGYQLALAGIEADKKQAKQKIQAQERAFKEKSKSFDKDKKSLRKLYEQTIQKALNAQDMAEYQRLMDIANHLNAQLDNIRHDQLASYDKLINGIGQVGGHNRQSGYVIDGDYNEVA